MTDYFVSYHCVYEQYYNGTGKRYFSFRYDLSLIVLWVIANSEPPIRNDHKSQSSHTEGITENFRNVSELGNTPNIICEISKSENKLSWIGSFQICYNLEYIFRLHYFITDNTKHIRAATKNYCI